MKCKNCNNKINEVEMFGNSKHTFPGDGKPVCETCQIKEMLEECNVEYVAHGELAGKPVEIIWMQTVVRTCGDDNCDGCADIINDQPAEDDYDWSIPTSITEID